MVVNISKLIIETSSAGFDWNNLLQTALGAGFGAGFGAWFGTKLSLNQRKKDENYKNFQNFHVLLLLTSNLRDSLLNFKRDIIIPKKTDLKEKCLSIISGGFIFDIDISQYHFLAEHNSQILSLIAQILDSRVAFKDSIKYYNELMEKFRIEKPKGDLNHREIDQLESSIKNLEFTTNLFLYFVVLLLKTLLKYNTKYFMQIENKKINLEYVELENNTKDLLPKIGDIGVPKNWETILDNWI